MRSVHWCLCWGRKGETIKSQILNINDVVSDLWLQGSRKKHTVSRKRIHFSFLLPGRRERFVCDPFHTSLWICGGAPYGCVLKRALHGVYQRLPRDRERDCRLSWGWWACLWQAAVISGAQRAEFIRLSWGCEPFRPATLQFVSHSASRTAAWMWLARAHAAVLPRARLLMPPVARCMWIPDCREAGASHVFAWLGLLQEGNVPPWMRYDYSLRLRQMHVERLLEGRRLLWKSIPCSKSPEMNTHLIISCGVLLCWMKGIILHAYCWYMSHDFWKNVKFQFLV